MIRRPPRSTRTDTLFPYTTLFRSPCRLFREACAMLKIVAGDFPEGANVSLDTGVFGTAVKKVVIQIHLFRYQRYRRAQVHRFELVTTENSRSTAGAPGWGAAGAPPFAACGLRAGGFVGPRTSL